MHSVFGYGIRRWEVGLGGVQEYFEQALGPETLRKWHLLHTPGEGMWIQSGPWRVKQDVDGSACKFSRHVVFTQDLGDKAFLARIVGALHHPLDH